MQWENDNSNGTQHALVAVLQGSVGPWKIGQVDTSWCLEVVSSSHCEL